MNSADLEVERALAHGSFGVVSLFRNVATGEQARRPVPKSHRVRVRPPRAQRHMRPHAAACGVHELARLLAWGETQEVSAAAKARAVCQVVVKRIALQHEEERDYASIEQLVQEVANSTNLRHPCIVAGHGGKSSRSSQCSSSALSLWCRRAESRRKP